MQNIIDNSEEGPSSIL